MRAFLEEGNHVADNLKGKRGKGKGKRGKGVK